MSSSSSRPTRDPIFAFGSRVIQTDRGGHQIWGVMSSTLTPGLRKFTLTAHVTSSVGWLGAVAGLCR